MSMSQIYVVKVGIENHVNSKGDIHDVERKRHPRPERQNLITPRVVLAAALSMCLGAGLGCGVEDASDLSDEDSDGAHIDSVESDVTAAPCTLHAFPFRWVCINRVGALVYQGPNTSTPHGHALGSGSTVFQCRIEGGFSGGGTHASRWEHLPAGGYVRDIDVASETNILPICP